MACSDARILKKEAITMNSEPFLRQSLLSNLSKTLFDYIKSRLNAEQLPDRETGVTVCSRLVAGVR